MLGNERPCKNTVLVPLRLRGGSEAVDGDDVDKDGPEENDEMVDEWANEPLSWVKLRIHNLCFGRNEFLEAIVDPEMLVKDFKAQLYLNHSTAICDPEQMDMTCKGRELMGLSSDQLSDYGVGTRVSGDEGSEVTIILKQKFISIALNQASSRGHEAIGPDSIQGLIQSPMFQHLLSNPQLLQQVMQTPQFQQLLQASPELRRILEDPSALKKALQGDMYGDEYTEEGIEMQYPDKRAKKEGPEDSHTKLKRIAELEDEEALQTQLKFLSDEERAKVDRTRARILREKRGWDREGFKIRLKTNSTLAAEYAHVFRRFKTIEAVRGNISASAELTAKFAGVASALDCAYVPPVVSPQSHHGSGAISSDFLQDALRMALDEPGIDDGPPPEPLALPSASSPRGSPPRSQHHILSQRHTLGSAPLSAPHGDNTPKVQLTKEDLDLLKIDDLDDKYIEAREDEVAMSFMQNNPRYAEAISAVSMALLEYYFSKQTRPAQPGRTLRDLPDSEVNDIKARLRPIIAVVSSSNASLAEFFDRMVSAQMKENVTDFVGAVEAYLSCLIVHPRVERLLEDLFGGGGVNATARNVTATDPLTSDGVAPPAPAVVIAPDKEKETQKQDQHASDSTRLETGNDQQAPVQAEASKQAPTRGPPSKRKEDNIGRLGVTDLGVKPANARALGTERVKCGDAAMRKGDFAAAAGDFEAAAELLSTVEGTAAAVEKLRKLAQAATVKHQESLKKLEQPQAEQKPEEPEHPDSDEEMQDEETLRRRRLRVLFSIPPPPPPPNVTVPKTHVWWPNPPNSGLTEEEWNRELDCKLWCESHIRTIRNCRRIVEIAAKVNETMIDYIHELAANNISEYEERLRTMDLPYSEWEEDTEAWRMIEEDQNPPKPAESAPPDEKYKAQLEQMLAMGFADVDANLRALIDTGGNVENAVSQLLGG
jgi:hypothetical protein